MAMKVYKWRGNTYQIADEDVRLYPGAVPVEAPKKKKEEAPKDKARKTAKNKAKKEK